MNTHPKDRRKDSLLRRRDVCARTGLTEATIRRRERAGTFPHSIPLGEKARGYYQSDVEDWIADPSGYKVETSAAA